MDVFILLCKMLLCFSHSTCMYLIYACAATIIHAFTTAKYMHACTVVIVHTCTMAMVHGTCMYYDHRACMYYGVDYRKIYRMMQSFFNIGGPAPPPNPLASLGGFAPQTPRPNGEEHEIHVLWS